MTALKEGGTLTDNPMDVCVGGCLLGSAHNFSGNSYLKVHINPSLTREIGASSKTVFISFHSVSRQETIVVSRYIPLYAEVSSRSALFKLILTRLSMFIDLYTADYAECW